MHGSPQLVIWQRGEKRVKFSKEATLGCVSEVGLLILRISTSFALHSPDES